METLRAVLTLVATCGLLFVEVVYLNQLLRQGLRLALLAALAINGFLVWLITEGLGWLRALEPAKLAFAWGVAVMLLYIVGVKTSKVAPRAAVVHEFREMWRGVRSLPGTSQMTLAFMGLVFAVLAVTGFLASPNTWDSLTYHLSRVMHWEQNRTLAFYATGIQRQLAFGPMAEMAMLNLQLLAGSDRLASLVQLTAMLGCAVGASYVAERLGVTEQGQVFAGLAALTLPMGVLQATSTQNDLVVALWCVTFAAFVLHQLERETRISLAVFTGLALGLAVLTKVTALLYLPFFGCWYALAQVRRGGPAAWQPLSAVLVVGALIMAPQLSRNYALYRNLLGTAPGPELSGYLNESFSPRIVASNLLRNTAVQLATPSTRLNQALQDVVVRAHEAIRIGIDSPMSTFRGEGFKVGFTLHEDSANNVLAMILLIFAIPFVVLGRKEPLFYVLCVAGGYLLLCGLLKWQPWNSRLELPLFVLAAPLLALAVMRLPGTGARQILTLALAVGAMPYLLANSGRPLVGANSILRTDRLSQYFHYPGAEEAMTSYLAAANALEEARCEQLGLISAYEDPEYLVWVTARAAVPGIRVEHVLVRNASGQIGNDFVPCAILATTGTDRKQITYAGRSYERAFEAGRLTLFLDQSAAQ